MTQSGCSDKAAVPNGAHAAPSAARSDAPATTPFTVWTQRADSGLTAEWIGHGAHLVAVRAPDGTPLLAGLPTPEAYADEHPHTGGLIGRVANRIAGGRFIVDGETHDVPATENGNTLHSGPNGFDAQDWDVREDVDGLVFRHTSPAGNQNYPGNLDVIVRSVLTDRELRVEFTAITDAPTPVNLTQHGYWNPSGLFVVPADALVLQSPADRYVAVDAALIPTGETPSVDRSPYDFREARQIGPNPIDLTLMVPGEDLREMAQLSDGTRTVTVLSDYPGFQLYTGEALGGVDGFAPRGAIAIEPQYPPNAVNQPIDGHDTILRPGEVYRHAIVYRFAGPDMRPAEPVAETDTDETTDAEEILP